VAIGGCDSYVDLAGIGMSRIGDLAILLGSTLILGRVMERDEAVDGLRVTPHHGAGWFFGGWTSACGTLLDWSTNIDAIALSALDLSERVLRATGPCNVARVGGGGTRNPALVSAVADATGVPLEIAAHAGEAMPPALLALRAIGIEPEVRIERRVRPNAERTRRYQELLKTYRGLYPALSSSLHALGQINAIQEGAWQRA
jgi:sugar (pentulose or hexulose) kinase